LRPKTIYKVMKKHLLLTSLGLAACFAGVNAQSVVNFSFTGAPQSFTVPNCVNTLTITCRGAQGGSGATGGSASNGGTGGLGANAIGVLTVTPGQVLSLYVGGQGTIATGGFNGGGNGGNQNAGGGGGATDVRVGGMNLSNRAIVAAGGGGGGRGGCEAATAIGGNGGNSAGNGLTGVYPGTLAITVANGGAGATGTVAGAAGVGCSGFLGQPGTNGILGVGGNGGNAQTCCCFNALSNPGGGGGGGGYFGGGGGGGGSAGTIACAENNKGGGGGGAGGTNYFDASVTGTAVTNGTVTGNGQIIIQYSTFPVVAAATSTATVCAGSAAVLSATGANTYSWSGVGAGASVTVNPTSNTVYTVVGTTSGCTDTKTVAVSTILTPSLSFSPSAPSSCVGTTVSLTASGANTYSWNTGATTAAVTVTATTAAITLTATGTGTNGCVRTQTVTVTGLANPTVNVTSSSNTICINGSASLTAGGASTYSWNQGSTTAAIVVSPTLTTTYTVTGTAANGCKSNAVFTQVVSPCTGINEISKANLDVTLSPNPATKLLMVKTSLNVSEFAIIDITGKEVMKGNFTNQEAEVNVSALTNGVYFVKVNSSVFKFVKN
jgi:hypothetical protein